MLDGSGCHGVHCVGENRNPNPDPRTWGRDAKVSINALPSVIDERCMASVTTLGYVPRLFVPVHGAEDVKGLGAPVTDRVGHFRILDTMVRFHLEAC